MEQATNNPVNGEAKHAEQQLVDRHEAESNQGVDDAEAVELPTNERPPLAHKDGPFDIAIWTKRLENGRLSIRMELSVYSKDKEGNDRTEKVSFWLRDAYAISNRIELLARQADMRMLVRATKAA